MSAAELIDKAVAAAGGAAVMLARIQPLQAVDAHIVDAVRLVCGSALKPEPVRWLWHSWLARGKLHILAGAPGQGKTTINLSFASVVTRGGRWPDGSKCEPGNVLIWSGEDDPTDTLLPRLIAMGADPARVYFVDGARIAGEDVAFDPARDLGHLLLAAEKIGGCALLIVDPVVSAVMGDSHKNTEVRRALQPLVDLARALDCAVVGVSHFSKGSAGRDPTDRVVGSVAFGAVARVVMVAARIKADAEGNEQRILARSKSNIGPDDGGFHYAIEQTDLVGHPGIQASRIVWGAAVEGSARELLTEPDAPGTEAQEPDHDTEGFLRDLLADGVPVPSSSVKADGLEAGMAWRTLHRAAKKIGVRIRKSGMAGGWFWSLPKMTSSPEGAEGAEDVNVSNVAPSASSVASSEVASSGDDVETF